jgi:hypothetical protein
MIVKGLGHSQYICDFTLGLACRLVRALLLDVLARLYERLDGKPKPALAVRARLDAWAYIDAACIQLCDFRFVVAAALPSAFWSVASQQQQKKTSKITTRVDLSASE